MKKLCVFIISMFFCLTSLYAANQTNANTIKEDLKCFYTRLDKENIFILFDLQRADINALYLF